MALRVDHQVGRLDIAVDDAFGVRMAQGLQQLVDDGQSARNGQALAGHQRLVQIVALHQFHDNVGQPAVTPLVEHLDDVRVMRQDGTHLGLGGETPLQLIHVVSGMAGGADGLDRLVDRVFRVVTLVDKAHATLANDTDDLKVGNLAGMGGHGAAQEGAGLGQQGAQRGLVTPHQDPPPHPDAAPPAACRSWPACRHGAGPGRRGRRRLLAGGPSHHASGSSQKWSRACAATAPSTASARATLRPPRRMASRNKVPWVRGQVANPPSGSCCAGCARRWTSPHGADRQAGQWWFASDHHCIMGQRRSGRHTQFSTVNPATRLNSASLLVTSTAVSAKAWQAIHKSFDPIGVPAAFR